MKQETGETLRKQEETPPQQETSPPASARVIQILPHRLQALPVNLILPPLSNASNPPQMKTERFELRLAEEQLARIDEWRRDQADLPTKSEAVRRLVEFGLNSSKPSRISGAETPRIKSSKFTK